MEQVTKVVARASRISRTLLSQINVLSDVNEPGIVDSEEVVAGHFFCARRYSGGGEGCSLVGGRGQARGLPLRERLRGKSARVGGRGQAQGLPLQERLRGKTALVGGEGRHKACPYRGV